MKLEQLTLFVEVFHVKMLALLEQEKDSMEQDLHYGSSLQESLQKLDHNGLSLKMYQACYHQTMDKILEQSSISWTKAGMVWDGKYSALKNLDYHNNETEYTLSQVLEHNVPARYYLSKKTCTKILQRVKRKNKIIPRDLEAALKQIAEIN